MDLAFCLKVPLDSLLVWASSGGSGETARMRRLAWTFAARIGDKYKIRLMRPKNEAMFKEYCNDPVMTRQRITDDGWYKTDDVGYMTENGVFFCTSRKSEIILSGGLSVKPSILEAILTSCPGVARAACVPVSRVVMFHVVCACVVRTEGRDLAEQELRRFCEEMLTDKPRLFTALPTFYIFFDKLPETYTGKVNKKELKKMAEYKFGAK